jgi:hypothetical protein
MTANAFSENVLYQNRKSVQVGRDTSNDIVIQHPSVSSFHCVLRLIDNVWVITDSNSRNGTFVNGTRITSSAVKNGDVVLLGLVGYRFEEGNLVPQSIHALSVGDASGAAKKQLVRRARIWIPLGLAATALVAGLLVFSIGRRSGDSGKAVETSKSEAVDPYSAPTNLGPIIEKVRESVVGVACGESSGTGWILSLALKTVIVTNHHVVAECLWGTKPTIQSGTQKEAVAVQAADASTDLAILASYSGRPGLKTSGPPEIGSWLMIIGNPLGLDRSVNFGSLTNISDGYLITDAAINPGNSGGPVFNSHGEVVGIASAKLVAEGIDRIGLVIPLADLCLEVLECEVGQWR